MTTICRTHSRHPVEYLADTGWLDRPASREPTLDGAVRCEVAVVGGGLAGMSAALSLAERGVDVVLLESDLCGWGATARSAGYLTGTLGTDPALLDTVFRSRLPDLNRFADRAVRFAEGLIARLQIDCDFESTGILGVAVSPAQLKRARKMHRFFGDAGKLSELVDRDQLGVPGRFLGGIREPIGRLLNPAKYALGVRAAVIASGARVFERTPADHIEDHGSRVSIRTPRGRVSAERVVLATNAASRDLDIAPPRIATPLWLVNVATEPLTPERVQEIGWGSRTGTVTLHTIMESYRLTADNRIVFGTRKIQPAQGRVHPRRPDERVVADLMRGFRDRFPELKDVAPERAWGGWVAVTSTWLPIAGDATKNVSYLIGCNGHGLCQAPYLGKLVADRVAGDDVDELLRAVWRGRDRLGPGVLGSTPVIHAGWALDRMADRVQRRRG